ncbi:MAG: NAPDH-dependent diflavin reductase [Sclerophora amabilis]|nr:MAG: NAPDH-dependent diflavin reductase [Sclerophora amabilis]
MSSSVQSDTKARSALILFGSEYGNAQDAAEELGRIVERLHILARVAEMNSIHAKTLSAHSFVIVVTSTTGQGDVPANAQLFWRSLLRKRLPQNYLCGVNFTTFGLGDSSYPKFNWAVRKIHKRLAQLGAQEIYTRGEADEQHPEGIDGSFLPWLVDFRKHLLDILPLPPGLLPIPEDVLLPPKWMLELLQLPDLARSNEVASALQNGEKTSVPDDSLAAEPLTNGVSSPPNQPRGEPSPLDDSLTMTLSGNSRLTPDTHWQDVRHLTFTMARRVDYIPGDVLTVFPKNFPEDVNTLIVLMNWESVADEPIGFTRTASAPHIQNYPPPPVQDLLPDSTLTLRILLTSYLDITAIPRRSFFSLIAHFTNDSMHKERLLEFTNPEYVDELYDYTSRPRRSILEVLQEFESVKIPWNWAANVLPILRGRQFSIASGGSLKATGASDAGTRIELLVAIVRYRTVIKKIREGVCTRYLASLPVGTNVDVRLVKGSLNIKRTDKRPVVLIGPGTGVAPIRSLLWERLAWSNELEDDRNSPSAIETGSVRLSYGKSVLFYGSRNQDADYFFRQEWTDLQDKMDLEVFPAFSRDQPHKVYVQHRIREQSILVYNLLHELSGVVYICGSSGKMPQAIREALIEVFQSRGALTRDESETYLLHMEKEGRYKQETW